MKQLQLDATTLPIEEEEEDGEPLVKGEDDIPKGCWYHIIIIINIIIIIIVVIKMIITICCELLCLHRCIVHLCNFSDMQSPHHRTADVRHRWLWYTPVWDTPNQNGHAILYCNIKLICLQGFYQSMMIMTILQWNVSLKKLWSKLLWTCLTFLHWHGSHLFCRSFLRLF